jgi:hypothetical protein
VCVSHIDEHYPLQCVPAPVPFSLAFTYTDFEMPRRGLAALLQQLFDLDNYTFKQQELVCVCAQVALSMPAWCIVAVRIKKA